MWHKARFLSFWAGFGVVPGFFLSYRSPPLSAGVGLGNQAALLWPRTRFLSVWAGFGVVPAFSVLPILPRSVPGRGLGLSLIHI